MRISALTTCAACSGIWGSPNEYAGAITYSEKRASPRERDGGHAKPYQVRQVRIMLLKYELEDE